MFNQAGEYAALVHGADKASRPWLWLVAALWVVCPFFVRTAMLNPGDMIWLQDRLQGIPVPGSFSSQQTAIGEVEALMALGVLILLQLVATVMFYRRSALDIGPVATPVLWPLAALLPGILGSAAWLAWKGYFDPLGCIMGLSPAWLTFGAEMLVNRLGKNFVYGQSPASYPPLAPQSAQGPVSYFIPE
jgi:hypothetical protein